MVSHVYLLYSSLLKLIHIHTTVGMSIHSINIIAQSYLYTKAHAITQFIDEHIYTYVHTRQTCYPLKYIKPVISSHLERDSHNYVGRYTKTYIQTFEKRLNDMDIGTQSHTDDRLHREEPVCSGSQICT